LEIPAGLSPSPFLPSPTPALRAQVWVRNPYPVGDERYRESWLPSPLTSRPPWVPGEILSLGEGPAAVDVTVTTTLAPRVSFRVSASEVLPMNDVTSLHDLSDFTFLHEAAVLHNVLRRHLEGEPVTRAGPLTLAVNPCRTPVDANGVSLYDPIYMARYHGRVSSSFLEALPPEKRAGLALGPHLYEVAERAHVALTGDLLNQAIVFMGEGASGKSEAFKASLQYLLSIAPLEAQGVRPGAASLTLVQNTAAVIAAGRQIQAAPALLGKPDLAGARAEAERRRGPLGTSRNPWVTSPPLFAGAVGGGDGARSGTVGAARAPSASASSSSSSSPSSGAERRLMLTSADFFQDDAPLPTARGAASTAAGVAASSSLTGSSSSSSSSVSAAAASASTPLKALAATMPRFSRALLAGQTVLEAFGAAATGGNPNSTRFARSVKLYCDGHGNIVSGRMDTAVLERRRVLGAALDPRAYGLTRTGPGAGAGGTAPGLPSIEGRNFHIFYQLLAGAGRELRGQLQLGSPADYLCLHQRAGAGVEVTVAAGGAAAAAAAAAAPSFALASSSSASSSASMASGPASGGVALAYVHGVPLPVRSMGVPGGSFPGGPGTEAVTLSAYGTALTDGEDFAATCKALSEIGLDASAQTDVFRLLSALLMAGNLRFATEAGSADPQQQQGAAALATPSEANLLADLLGVDRSSLADVLLKKSRGGAAGPYSPNPSDSPVQRPTSWAFRKSAEARASVDAAAMVLYERLFAWLVGRINEAAFRASGGQAMVDAVLDAAPPGQTEPLHLVLFDGSGAEGALSPAAEARLYARPDEDDAAGSVWGGAAAAAITAPNTFSYLTAGSGALSAAAAAAAAAPLTVDVRALRGLDALCANYAAERVHDLFLTCVFRGEVSLYEAEGVLAAANTGAAVGASGVHVSYDDNAHIVDMFDNRRTGLLLALDESTSFGRASDAMFLSSAVSLQRRNPALLRPTILAPPAGDGPAGGAIIVTNLAIAQPGSSDAALILVAPSASAPEVGGGPVSAAAAAGYDQTLLFGVRHTAGTVLYSASAFLSLNRASGADRLDADLAAVLRTSSVALVRDLACTDAAELSGTAAASASASPSSLAGSRSVSDISRLLGPLALPSVVPHFVRCLRPNTRLQPGFVDGDLLQAQVAQSGVLHALVLHHSGFSYKATFAEFYERYIILVQQKGRLTSPPPRGADLRDLCRELLAAVMLHPAFTGMILAARRNAHFGRTKVLLRRHLAETLESLRDARLLSMDRQAVKVQAVWRGYIVRRDLALVWDGVRRMQAAFRATKARAEWLRVRYAAQVVQAAIKRWMVRRRFLAHVAAVCRIQRWFRTQRRLRVWRSTRRGVHQLHALSRGYIVRAHVMRMLAAVSRLQGAARMFLASLRLHRLKMAAAAALQAAWRGNRFRVDHEEVLAFLAVKRETRAQGWAAESIQSAWRGSRVQRRYGQLRSAAVVLQRWYATRLQRQRYSATVAALVVAQSAVRRFLAQIRVRRTRALREVADELWRVQTVRARELVELAKATAEDALQPLPAAARLAVASAAGIAAPSTAGSSAGGGGRSGADSAASMGPATGGKPPRAGAAAAGATPGANMHSGAGALAAAASGSAQAASATAALAGAVAAAQATSASGGGTYAATLLLDVDTLTDTSAAHPATLTRALHSLEMDLRAAGTRISSVSLGGGHAAVVTETGQVYTWGFGDRGQCGHGRAVGEQRPRLVEQLLVEREGLVTAAAAATSAATAVAAAAAALSKGPSSSSSSSGARQGGSSSSTSPTQGGPGGVFSESLPRTLAASLRIRAVACGNEHTVALAEVGKLFAWGGNRRGQCGLGHTEPTAVPTHVRLSLRDADAAALPVGTLQSPTGGVGGDSFTADLTRIAEVATGAHHTVALTSAGLVFAWGDGACLGQGVFSGTGDSATPLPVRALLRSRVRHIASGPNFVAVVTNAGDVFTWGSGKDGVLGVGEDVARRKLKAPAPASAAGTSAASKGSPQGKAGAAARPAPLSPADPAAAAAAAEVASGGGADQQYEYVVGKFRPRFVPTLVDSLASYDKHSRIISVACGARHCIAVSSTGRVYTWGSNSHAQLGLGVVGPVTEEVLRRHGGRIPTLPLHTQREAPAAAAAASAAAASGGADAGKRVIAPRTYVATPVWVSSLEQQHVTSAVAGARSCAVLTDMREAFAWGCTSAPWPTVDLDVLLVRASNIAGGGAGKAGPSLSSSPSPPDSRRGSFSSVAPPVPAAAAAKGAAAGKAGGAGGGAAGSAAAAAAAKLAATQIAQNPIYLAETGRGPRDLCVFPVPTEVPVASLPGRKPQRLVGAHAASASVLAVSYTQMPLGEGALRDAALARSLAPGKGVPSQAQVDALPSPSSLMASLVTELDVSQEPASAPVSLAASSAAAQGIDRLLQLELRSPSGASAAAGTGKRGGAAGAQPAPSPKATPATAHLLAALSSAASPDGPSANAAAAGRRRALQGALLRGVVGLPDPTPAPPPADARSTPAAAAATAGRPPSASARKASSVGAEERQGAASAVSSASSSGAAARSASPQRRGSAAAFDFGAQLPAMLTNVHPSVARVALGLARDPAGASAVMGLSAEQVRSMTPAQMAIVADRLKELSGSGNPGARAASAAAAAVSASASTAALKAAAAASSAGPSSSTSSSSGAAGPKSPAFIRRAIASGNKAAAAAARDAAVAAASAAPSAGRTRTGGAPALTAPPPPRTPASALDLFLPGKAAAASPSGMMGASSAPQPADYESPSRASPGAAAQSRRPAVAPLYSAASTSAAAAAVSPTSNGGSPRAPLTIRDMLASSSFGTSAAMASASRSIAASVLYAPSSAAAPSTAPHHPPRSAPLGSSSSSSSFSPSTLGSGAEAIRGPASGVDLSAALEAALATAAAQDQGHFSGAALAYTSSSSGGVQARSAVAQGLAFAPATPSGLADAAAAAAPYTGGWASLAPGASTSPLASSSSSSSYFAASAQALDVDDADDIADRVMSLQRQLEAVRLRSAAVMALQSQQAGSGPSSMAAALGNPSLSSSSSASLPALPNTPGLNSTWMTGAGGGALNASRATTYSASPIPPTPGPPPLPPSGTAFTRSPGAGGSAAAAAAAAAAASLTPAARLAILSQLQAELTDVSGQVEAQLSGRAW
jgi:alpha-tubulin suppressor-like RCC1 family protein